MMFDPDGWTDRKVMDVLARVDRRLGDGPKLNQTQRTAIWNSAWEVIYLLRPMTTDDSARPYGARAPGVRVRAAGRHDRGRQGAVATGDGGQAMSDVPSPVAGAPEPTTIRWFGHAAHFICGRWCRFHLATQVGPYLISTVGEYWPERPVREIHARVHDPVWLAENVHRKGDDFDHAYMKRFGFEDIGYERKYETMVFKAGQPCVSPECNCGLPTIEGSELDFAAYNAAGAASAGHMALVRKWAAPSADAPPPEPEGNP